MQQIKTFLRDIKGTVGVVAIHHERGEYRICNVNL